MKKKIIISLVAIIVVVALALAGASYYLVSYAIGRSGDGGNRQVALEVDDKALSSVDKMREENRQIQEQRNKEFEGRIKTQTIEITSDDGLTLVGAYYPNEKSHNWAITVHGYRGDHFGVTSYSERYHSNGFQVLAPDLRGCGDSGGDYVGMGWPDRYDILNWISWIEEKDPYAQIVIHGVSMGAATVMSVSGEETPDSVVCFIEDCGYTSVWDIFESELHLRFSLPAFPILYTASGMAKACAGYSFGEASAYEQVSKCEKPMLFIHGSEDDFVPYEMLDTLYNAKPNDNKQKLVAKNAGHGEARLVLGEKYWKAVFDFVNKSYSTF